MRDKLERLKGAYSRPPHGGRGLKSKAGQADQAALCRPPHGGRGLKSVMLFGKGGKQVSPSSRRAWIEIWYSLSSPAGACVALLTEGVD